MGILIIIAGILIIVSFHLLLNYFEKKYVMRSCPMCGEKINRSTLPIRGGTVPQYEYYCECGHVSLKSISFYDIYDEFGKRLEELNITRISKGFKSVNKLSRNIKREVIESCIRYNTRHFRNQTPQIKKEV